MAKKTVTLREMARQAGVNVGTVSRALANDPAISDARKQEIQALAERLSYRPRPFRRKKTNAIAILSVTRMHDAAEDLFQEYLIVSLEQKAQRAGWHTHLYLMPRGGKDADLPALLTERRVDGVILSGHPSRDLCDRLASEDIPLAVINDTHKRTGLPSVFCDPTSATDEVIDRLVELGHKHIAFAFTDLTFTSIELRYEAYLQRLAHHGLEPILWQRSNIEQSDTASGQHAVRELFDSTGPNPTAILVTNDWMALGGMIELANLGLKVPQDVSLAGCDNVYSVASVEPKLTSIDLAIEKQVELALDMIDQQINDTLHQKQLFVPPELIWRNSIAPTNPNAADRLRELSPEPAGSTTQGVLS